jgi:hypothetical protein
MDRHLAKLRGGERVGSENRCITTKLPVRLSSIRHAAINFGQWGVTTARTRRCDAFYTVVKQRVFRTRSPMDGDVGIVHEAQEADYGKWLKVL